MLRTSLSTESSENIPIAVAVKDNGVESDGGVGRAHRIDNKKYQKFVKSQKIYKKQTFRRLYLPKL